MQYKHLTFDVFAAGIKKMGLLRGDSELEGACQDHNQQNALCLFGASFGPRENRVLPRCHSDSAMQTLTFSVSLRDIPSKKGIHKILVNCLKKNMKLFMLMPTLSLNQE